MIAFRLLTAVIAVSCLAAGTVCAYDWAGNGWALYGDHCYKVVAYTGTSEHPWISWADAADAAWDMGIEGYNTYLAAIGSEAEYDFTIYLNEMTVPTGVWLGGYQDPLTTQTDHACWSWIPETRGGTSTPFTFGDPSGGAYIIYPWLHGEPNDMYGPGTEQYLAYVAGGWNDYRIEDDNNVRHYLVEASPVPEPSTLSAVLAGLSSLSSIHFASRRRKS